MEKIPGNLMRTYKILEISMKKCRFILFSAAVTLLLSACAGGSAGSVQKTADHETGEGIVHTVLEESISGTGQQEKDVQQENLQDSRILVAYFSWADNAVQDYDMDAVTSPSVTVPGNTAQLARWVSEQTGNIRSF